MSNYQTFFEGDSFILVGNSKKRGFPKLTLQGLINSGKTVYPIDPELTKLNGHKIYKDLDSAPQNGDRMILEVPAEETESWIEKASRAGIKDIWIHQGCDSTEAVNKAKKAGINVRRGACAVMYLTEGFNIHGFHRGIMKLLNKF